MTNQNPQDPPIEPIEPVEPTEPVPQPTEPTEPAEPHGANGEPTEPTEPIDWKKHSRDWEERSKTNLARAEKAEGEKAAIEAELEAAKSELATLKASNERAEAVRSAAKAANVDEGVLSRMTGETPEEIAENARILAAATRQTGSASYPSVSDNGAGGNAYGYIDFYGDYYEVGVNNFYLDLYEDIENGQGLNILFSCVLCHQSSLHSSDSSYKNHIIWNLYFQGIII